MSDKPFFEKEIIYAVSHLKKKKTIAAIETLTHIFLATRPSCTNTTHTSMLREPQFLS